jgi:hypothetical protein
VTPHLRRTKKARHPRSPRNIRNSDTRSQQQPGVPPGADSTVTLQYGLEGANLHRRQRVTHHEVSSTRERPTRGITLFNETPFNGTPFNGTPWAVLVTVGAITVTAQATSSADRHDTQGSGDFYLATNGDIHLAISGDLQLATYGDFDLAMDTSHGCQLRRWC